MSSSIAGLPFTTGCTRASSTRSGALERITYWQKECESGVRRVVATERRTPLSHSFCQYVILSSAPLEVTDARTHPVVKGNPAIEELNVIAYLGVPLITRRGETLGSLCTVDHEPREWTDRDRLVLRDLAAATVTEIELRRTTREAVDLAEKLEAALRGGKETSA